MPHKRLSIQFQSHNLALHEPLLSYGIQSSFRQSMSAKGDCYDNSPMESFFATLKKELIHKRRFKTREQAKIAIISYIETWYNPKRIHSSLGDMSPIEFERCYLLSQGLAAS